MLVLWSENGRLRLTEEGNAWRIGFVQCFSVFTEVFGAAH